MKTVLLLISLNLVAVYSQAQQTEYHQVSTKESYNLACKPNSDGSMNCLKVNKAELVTAEPQALVKDKNSSNEKVLFFLGGLLTLFITYLVYLFRPQYTKTFTVYPRC